jgi:hypothetical protein
MVLGGSCPSLSRATGGSAAEEASAILDEALNLVGNGPEGSIYRQIVDSIWGADLFGEESPV